MEILQPLLDHNDGVDVNTFVPNNSNGGILRPPMSPLCRTCRRNNLEMAQLLIQHGAQVIFDGVYPGSPSPLWEQAVQKDSLALLRLLLDNSPFAESANENERTHPLSPPLEIAILWDRLENKTYWLVEAPMSRISHYYGACQCAALFVTERHPT
jgi:hypothetical protein